MQTKRRIIILFFACFSLLACALKNEKSTEKESIQGTQTLVAQNVRMDHTISYDGTKIAFTVYTGSLLKGHEDIFINEKKLYDSHKISNIIFSFDSEHIAFTAMAENGKWSVLVDDDIIGEYDDVGVKSLVFSPDNTKLAFSVKRGSKCSIGVYDLENGEYSETDLYEDVGSRVSFSPDGKRFAYSAKTSDGWVVVLDGKKLNGHDLIGKGTLIFSPNGEHFAYAAKNGDKWIVIRDGKKSEPFDGIIANSLVFSPTGSHFCYAASSGKKQFVIMDNKHQKEYLEIGSGTLSFSPDEKRFGYAAKDKDGWFIVADGTEGRKYKTIYRGPIFSPDSAHYVYVAGIKRKMCLLRDLEVEEKTFDGIQVETISFSPNGANIAYVARRGSLLFGKYFLVVNDEESKGHDDVLLPDFQYLGLASLLKFGEYYIQGKAIRNPWKSDDELQYLAKDADNVYLIAQQFDQGRR